MGSQTTDKYVETTSIECNADCHFLPGGLTSELQVVDAGPGRELKRDAGVILDEMLIADKELCDKWTLGKVTAGDKRILVTKILGEAWDRVCARLDFHKLGLRTGCLRTSMVFKTH